MREERIVAGLLCAIAVGLLVSATRLRLPAGMAPIAVLIPTCAVMLVETARTWRGHASTGDAPRGDVAKARRAARIVVDPGLQHRRELLFSGWLTMVVAACLLVGTGIALPMFVLLWFRFQARQGWAAAVLAALPVALLLDWLLPSIIGLRLPAGVIGSPFLL